MSPCLITSPLFGQQWSIRWLKSTFSLQQASPVDPVWVKGLRFGNWPQHWRSFFVTENFVTISNVSYVVKHASFEYFLWHLKVHLESMQSLLVEMYLPSPRWDEKMSRFICVFIWTSTSDVHFDMKSPNESFSNWNLSIFGRSFSAMLVEHKQVLYFLCFRLILESRASEGLHCITYM